MPAVPESRVTGTIHKGVQRVSLRECLGQSPRFYSIPASRQNQRRQLLCVPAVGSQNEADVCFTLGLFQIAEKRLPPRAIELPDCCQFLVVRPNRRLNRMARQFPGLDDVPGIGFRLASRATTSC